MKKKRKLTAEITEESREFEIKEWNLRLIIESRIHSG
jgi:hypothetical protein